METRRSTGTYTIGTWNVCSLTNKKAETLAEVRRENVDIVVLTETKLRKEGVEDCGYYIHLYSGTHNGPARAGISILFKREIKVLRYEPVGERLITVSFDVCGQTITIIGVYWVDDVASKETKDRFQSKLERVLDTYARNEELILLGDFNARVGSEDRSAVVGPFGEIDINDNGRRLKRLCGKYGLKLQNTFFSHEDRHKYTWYRPRPAQRTLIDYFITRQSPSFNVDDVVVCRWLDCGTDHKFLRGTVSFSKESVGPSRQVRREAIELRRYKTYWLFSESVRTLYREFLESRIVFKHYSSARDVYHHLNKCIHDAAFHVLGVEERDLCGEFLWDDEMRRLNANTALSNPSPAMFKSMEAELKNEIWECVCHKSDKSKYLSTRRSILEEFHKIPFIDEDISQSLECKRILDEINLNCEEFIDENVETFSNGLEGFCEVHMTEVTEILDELDDDIFPSPGGLTIKLLRYGGVKCKQLLTDLIQRIFEDGDEVPYEVSETFLIPTTCTKIKWTSKTENIIYSTHPIMRIVGKLLENHLKRRKIFINTPSESDGVTSIEIVFVLRQLLQKMEDMQNNPFHIAVINLEKLYSEVELQLILDVMSKNSKSNVIIPVIEQLCNVNAYRIVTPSGYSKPYLTRKGLKLGWSLSSVLLRIYVQESIKEWETEICDFCVSMESRTLNPLFFNSTHLVIVSDEEPKFRYMLTSLKNRFARLHLNISDINYLGKKDLKIGNLTLKAKDTLYLEDFVLELGGRNVIEVQNRILETKQVIGVLHCVARDASISNKIKKKIFKSIVKRFLTLGCETWTLTDELKIPLKAVEISYWKWCREEYPQIFTSNELYDRMEVKHSLFDIIMLRKAAWYSSVMEEGKESWAKTILNWRPDGKYRSGGRRKKWMDGLEDYLKTFDLVNAEMALFQKNL